MHVFRNINLQRALSIVVLFAALFSQIHTLYACDSMEGMPKRVCCCGEHQSEGCPMADTCATQEKGEGTPCCEISYDTLYDAGMMNTASTVDCLILLLDGPQPPPGIECQQFPYVSLQMQSRLFLSAVEPPILIANPTYFLTRRLRL